MMNKSELVSAIADKSGLTKKDSEKALNAFLEAVEDALVNGDKVSLVGFGTFESRRRAARTGRNPRNPEEEIEIPAANVPAFRAGKSLKDALNQ